MSLSPRCIEARRTGYALLGGEGIEIGAFHEPAAVPHARKIRYVDAITKAEAIKLFPEVDASRLVDPGVIVDLDRDGLKPFGDGSLDFVVACHVLEHLANPLFALTEIFRVLKRGGRAAIGIPDKRFTFDRKRALTSFRHLWEDYMVHTTENADDHYLDFLLGTTGIQGLSPAEQAPHIAGVRARREHAHVWDSASFQSALRLTLDLTATRAHRIFESMGDENGFEYFGIWERD